MDKPMRKALEQYLLAVDGPVELGPRSEVKASDPTALRRRTTGKAPPLESLMLKRPTLTEMHGWQTTVPFLVIIALAITGVVLVVPQGTPAAIGVAIASSIAVLFRLMHVAERLKYRDTIFTLIELSARSKKCETTELIRLLLASENFRFVSGEPTKQPHFEP